MTGRCTLASLFSDEYIIAKVEAALDGKNPLIPFTATYQFHDILKFLGYYQQETFELKHSIKVKTSTLVYWDSEPIKYRVNHGEFITQNTLEPGKTVPHSEVI